MHPIALFSREPVVLTADAWAKPYDGPLMRCSHQHSNQSRGERRRGMLCTCGTRPVSGSSLFVSGVL